MGGMSRKPYPSELSDAEWLILEPLIPPAKRGGRIRRVNMREIVNAIYYVLRSGCAWRMLPHDFPPWQTLLGPGLRVQDSAKGPRSGGTLGRLWRFWARALTD